MVQIGPSEEAQVKPGRTTRSRTQPAIPLAAILSLPKMHVTRRVAMTGARSMRLECPCFPAISGSGFGTMRRTINGPYASRRSLDMHSTSGGSRSISDQLSMVGRTTVLTGMNLCLESKPLPVRDSAALHQNRRSLVAVADFTLRTRWITWYRS